MKKFVSPILLFAAAVIWGFAFVAQKAASAMPPFALGASRSAIAVLALTPAVILFDRLSKNGRHLFTKARGASAIGITKRELTGGVICGVLLFGASTLQQTGISGTDAGKTAFITALYVLIVPILELIMRRKSPPRAWVGVGIAVIGFYLLCIKSDFTIESSDLLVALCAVMFAAQIIAVDAFLPTCDGVRLSLIQFASVAIISAVCSLVFEGASAFSSIVSCIPEILFLGICSSGIAYTLQILGQNGTHPSVASIILSMESVFGALAAAIVLGERMSVKEYVGCGVVFLAVLVAQIDLSSLLKKVRARKS